MITDILAALSGNEPKVMLAFERLVELARQHGTVVIVGADRDLLACRVGAAKESKHELFAARAKVRMLVAAAGSRLIEEGATDLPLYEANHPLGELWVRSENSTARPFLSIERKSPRI